MGLELLVIGAQKAGTTTLWELLRDHPEAWLAETKEAPFFSHSEIYARGWEEYLRRLGAPSASRVRLRGTVTPHYMHGWQDAPTRIVAARIARLLPRVRLVALLRDPIARARSQHAMASARGREPRGAEQALAELLRPEQLTRARECPDDTNSYVVQGEYGRVLGEYLERFPRPALHLELTASLAREPVQLVRRILDFLGADTSYAPAEPFRRSFVGGGGPRVPDADLLTLLRGIDAAPREDLLAVTRAWVAARELDAEGHEELQRIVGRYLRAPDERLREERAGLEFALRKTWNFAPAPPPPISEELRAALAAHYARDAEALRELVGLTAPWAASVSTEMASAGESATGVASATPRRAPG